MIGTSGWLSSTSTLSMPRLRSAASRCSTVSTDALSDTSPVCSCCRAAKVRHVRGNLDAAEVDAAETNAVIGRRGLERERDFLAGMKADSGAGNGSAKGALCATAIRSTGSPAYSKRTANGVAPTVESRNYSSS